MDATHPESIEATGSAQLRLIEATEKPEWRLDDTTREVGRRGIAAARAALQTARRRDDGDGGSGGHGHSTAA
jgi:hypothetical protein